MFIALMLLANLAAYTARNKTMDRLYEEEISPQIDSRINEMQIDQNEFNREAAEVLPEGASLLKYLPMDESTTSRLEEVEE